MLPSVHRWKAASDGATLFWNGDPNPRYIAAPPMTPCSGGLRGLCYSCYDKCGTFVKFHNTSLASDHVFERGGPKKATYKHLFFFFPLPSYPSKELDSMMDVTAALFPYMVSFRGFNRFIASRCSVIRKLTPGRDLFLFVCEPWLNEWLYNY